MQALGFTTPISNSGKSFAGTAFFDNYFSFSTKRYRVVKTCIYNGKKGYQVEKHDVKQHLSLNILKALSYATVVLPVIMGTGKLIARCRNSFFIEKILPPAQGEVENRAQAFQTFKQQALAFQPKFEKTTLNWVLTQTQKDNLIKVYDKRFYPQSQLPAGAKVMRGGCNTVLCLDSIPGFVFKPMEELVDAQEYINVADKKRKFVADNKLYLLEVPEAQIVEINGHYFVMQEKANLISGNYAEQKGLYASCWKDAEMKEYMKALFSQLIIFISKSGFSDVKYDNIPLTVEGKVALIDSDNGNPVTGLTTGCARGRDGLLNYIPAEHFSEFLEFVKSQLDSQTYRALEQKVSQIAARVERKKKKDEDYSRYIQQNSIFSPSQKINPNLPSIFKDRRKQELVQAIIHSINLELSNATNLSVNEGRKVSLGINHHEPLFKTAQKIWRTYSTFPAFLHAFQSSHLPVVMERLKKAGYIHKYKIDHAQHCIKIAC